MKFDYSILALRNQIFLDSVEFQVNQENIPWTLAILKIFFAGIFLGILQYF